MIRDIAFVLGLLGFGVGFALALRGHVGRALTVVGVLALLTLLGFVAGQGVPPTEGQFLGAVLGLAAIPVAAGTVLGAVAGFAAKRLRGNGIQEDH